jgi:two-component system OmpR family response regulator
LVSASFDAPFAGRGADGTGDGDGRAKGCGVRPNEQAARLTRVLVVDDEPNICALLSATLRLTDFDVRTSANGTDALIAAEEFEPDLVVLDVMLPDLDGFQVARRLRASRPVPVLFLTARDAVEDRISGLTAGADDYVTKPFSLEEVVLRIRAILRRSRPELTDAPESGVLRYADLELNEDAHEVRRAGRLVDLSPTEFNLLQYLLINAGRVVSKAQILDRVWKYDFGGDGRIVESYVYYLRRKIDTTGVPLIHTVRGVGYALRLPRGGDE